MTRVLPASLLVISIALLASCGDDGGSTTARADSEGAKATRPAGGLPEGCSPQSVYRTLVGLTEAVEEEDRKGVLSYIAPADQLREFAFTYADRPGEPRATATTPGAVYRQFMRVGREGAFDVLAAATGPNAPLPIEGVSAAGTEFILAAGPAYGTGKSGLDCGTQRFYAWAMNVDTSLRRQLVCDDIMVSEGRVDDLHDDPVVCRI